jgi:hypothetical protein
MTGHTKLIVILSVPGAPDAQTITGLLTQPVAKNVPINNKAILIFLSIADSPSLVFKDQALVLFILFVIWSIKKTCFNFGRNIY